MVVVRFVGWLLVLAALIVLGRDLLAWHDTHVFAPVSFEELWGNLSRGGLDRFEAMVVRGAAPWVWTGIVHVLLRIWASLLFLILGLFLVWAGTGRGDERRRRRR